MPQSQFFAIFHLFNNKNSAKECEKTSAMEIKRALFTKKTYIRNLKQGKTI